VAVSGRRQFRRAAAGRPGQEQLERKADASTIALSAFIAVHPIAHPSIDKPDSVRSLWHRPTPAHQCLTRRVPLRALVTGAAAAFWRLQGGHAVLDLANGFRLPPDVQTAISSRCIAARGGPQYYVAEG
jgi:hypothetical protein